MSPLFRTLLVPGLAVLAAGAIALFAMNREATRVRAASAADKQLSGSQEKLLDLAFRTASALPANPHQKTRCRLQQDVVDTCFALDVPRRGLACTEKIEDWRRGLCYAAFAYYSVTHGASEEVPHYLELAQQVAAQGEPVITQDWQKARIQVGIARTHAWLGHAGEAAALEAGLEHAEIGKVDAVRAQRADPAAFDAQLHALEQTLAAGDLDLCKNALETGAQLFNRYYADADRRARVEQALRLDGTKIPLQIRIDSLIELSGFAIEHTDLPKALELAQGARKIFDSAAWQPEDQVQIPARLAALRFRAGAKEEARAELQATLARYESERAQITDIYRASALRPVAEAWVAMGDAPAALAAYGRAVEEGVGNPNSRPRAEDLVATCLSLARNGVEPDKELWGRIEKAFAGLGAPW
jgi:hypothetical protein